MIRRLTLAAILSLLWLCVASGQGQRNLGNVGNYLAVPAVNGTASDLMLTGSTTSTGTTSLYTALVGLYQPSTPEANLEVSGSNVSPRVAIAYFYNLYPSIEPVLSWGNNTLALTTSFGSLNNDGSISPSAVNLTSGTNAGTLSISGSGPSAKLVLNSGTFTRTWAITGTSP